MHLLSERDFCKKLGVSRGFIYRCRKKGMPYIRLGKKIVRYDLDNVIEWFVLSNLDLERELKDE